MFDIREFIHVVAPFKASRMLKPVLLHAHPPVSRCTLSVFMHVQSTLARTSTDNCHTCIYSVIPTGNLVHFEAKESKSGTQACLLAHALGIFRAPNPT